MCHKRHAPYVPPAQLGCDLLFPAARNDSVGSFLDGLCPGTLRFSAGYSTQWDAWLGDGRGIAAPRAIPDQALIVGQWLLLP